MEVSDKEALIKALENKVTPFALNNIISAYEMAYNAHANQKMKDGSSVFEHLSGVCKIITLELEITDPELIVSSLLKSIYQANDEISPDIVEYNFGAYVSLLTYHLNENTHPPEKDPWELDFGEQSKIQSPGVDFIIIRLAELLEKFRTMDFNPIYNPIELIMDTSKKYLGIETQAKNPHVDYLIKEIKKERNKILD